MEAAALPVGGRRSGRGLFRTASDDRLVERLRRGDEGAFEVLYDRHHANLLAFCRHMLGSREEAEDALQHVFLAVHRRITTDGRPLQLKAWMYAVARNRCLSMLRARRDAVALDDVQEPSTDGLAVAAAVEQREDLRGMLGDLAGLPDEQRAALVLTELGDLSHDEIGEALGVRKDKVKALVFQARESLMSARAARETDCREIQEQLASARGAALRRSTLRKHVAVCPNCAAFKAEVQRQRAAFAIVLPVIPSALLKKSVLAGVFGGGGGGGGAALLGGGAAAAGGGLFGSSGVAAKVLVAAAIAGGAGGGGAVAINQIQDNHGAEVRSVTPAAGGTKGGPATGKTVSEVARQGQGKGNANNAADKPGVRRGKVAHPVKQTRRGSSKDAKGTRGVRRGSVHTNARGKGKPIAPRRNPEVTARRRSATVEKPEPATRRGVAVERPAQRTSPRKPAAPTATLPDPAPAPGSTGATLQGE